jgi:NADPH:quinone reductase-like Zn-dependent oxidoreductase
VKPRRCRLWQLRRGKCFFEHVRLERGQSVMVLGAAGNVGAYAVQFAANAGFHVIAVVGTKDVAFARMLGANDVIDYRVTDFAGVPQTVDAVIDTLGGETRDSATRVLKPGGILVIVASTVFVPARADVRTVFFYVEVTTARRRRPHGHRRRRGAGPCCFASRRMPRWGRSLAPSPMRTCARLRRISPPSRLHHSSK